MKQSRKVRWYVKDDRECGLWWTGGKWRKIGERTEKQDCTNMKICRNKSNALKNAQKIKSLGGNPIMMCRDLRNRWKDWRLG